MGSVPETSHLFDDLPDRDRSPLRVRWWALALALHGGLLLLPIAWHEAGKPAAQDEPVAVTIFEPAPAVVTEAPSTVEEPRPEPSSSLPDTPVPEPIEPVVQQQREGVPAEPAETRRDSPAEPKPPALDVRQLLETVAAMDWSQTDPDEPRALGRSTESEITNALRQPVLTLTDNVFDGMAAPSEVEITDRWVSPGGDHNVVIRAPDGNTYCGRQAPVDDLRPWLQMPMLFHRCGGGGKRSGSAAWRNN